MKFIFKALLWIVILAAIGYGAWYAYNAWWGTGNAGIFVDTTAKNIGNAAQNKISELGTNVASNTVKNASTFLGITIGNLLSGLGGSLQSAGENLGASPAPVNENQNANQGNFLPIVPSGPAPTPTSSMFYVPPPPATIMTKINAPLSFSINSGKTYSVDWGDGKVAQGTTATNEVTVINHTWAKEGDYTVRMTIGDNGSQSSSSFPVRVYQ